MKVRADAHILRLIFVAVCCLCTVWLVRSPSQLAAALYAPNLKASGKTGNSGAKAAVNMGKAEALNEIKAAISANKVMVYSKSYCPYCTKAKNALNQFISPSKYTVVELDQRGDTDAMQDALLEVTGGRSVPRVFINGRFIGGGDDTAAAAANGSLQRMLSEAGVL